MIGITGEQFLDNQINWTADKLAIMFMAGYERPSYDPTINHYELRKQYALNWYNYMGGIPPVPIERIKKRKFPWAIYTNKIRNNRRTFF